MLRPTEATQCGVEGYDYLLNDYSDRVYGEEKAFFEEALRRIRKVSQKKLTPDEAVDYALLKGKLVLENYEFQKEDRRLRSPALYDPVSDIYYLTVKPIKDLFGSTMGRLERTPYLIFQGIRNLSRKEANPPALWVKMAIAAAKGGGIFIDTLPRILEEKGVLKAKIERDKLQNAIARANQALRNFVFFLETDLLPRSTGVYAVGNEYFDLLLKNKHFLRYDANYLLGLGEGLFEKTKNELAALAEEMMPGKSINDVARIIQEKHPSSLPELLMAYQGAMEAARNFTLEKGLVTFPPHELLRVVWTPEFSRNEIPFAAYLNPSPNDPEQIGHYYVTPAESEDLLREHNWIGIRNVSAHEAYPGHHLQFAIENSIPAAHTLPRLMNESSVFFEGWALYCEQLMHEQGFLDTREHRFVMLKDRLWRTLRIIIDVKTQTGRMTYDEAADLMVKELEFPREQACADLNWYSQAPATPLGYALGWFIINRLRDREMKRLGSKFNLREFHDKLLSCGAISLPLVIKRKFSNT